MRVATLVSQGSCLWRPHAAPTCLREMNLGQERNPLSPDRIFYANPSESYNNTLDVSMLIRHKTSLREKTERKAWFMQSSLPLHPKRCAELRNR